MESQQPDFKSKGEKKIAYFLDQNSIKYQYEPALILESRMDKPRIWYPDFHLPDFKTYIEYFGMTGDLCYERGIKRKETAYARSGVNVISVYPWMFNENWKGYIMDELKRNVSRQHRNLSNKPYWISSQNQQQWYRSAPGYHRNWNKRY